MKNFTAFARIAIIEKLNRDFNFNIDAKEGDFLQGKRTDLFDEENKAKKLPKMRRQAARARAGKKSPPRGGNASAKSPCSSGRLRGIASEKSSSAAASSSAPR